jgi:hypothetical protein
LISAVLAVRFFRLPIGLCGFGGVFSIRRNTSSRALSVGKGVDFLGVSTEFTSDHTKALYEPPEM